MSCPTKRKNTPCDESTRIKPILSPLLSAAPCRVRRGPTSRPRGSRARDVEEVRQLESERLNAVAEKAESRGAVVGRNHDSTSEVMFGIIGSS